MNTLTVVVGSTNPVKSRAAREAVRLAFGGTEPKVREVDVPSGVADQPFGDAETHAGALNRARAAREVLDAADLWIGLEGGVADLAPDGSSAVSGLECMAWGVVLGRSGGELRQGAARTASFVLPDEITGLVRSGVELGEATDRVLGVPSGADSSRRSTGTVGPLTGGALDRTAYYTHALVLALIPFRNPTLRFPEVPSSRETR